MMSKVNAKLEALAVKERERKKEAAAKQAAWEQEQARLTRERHAREAEEFKAAEALAAQRYTPRTLQHSHASKPVLCCCVARLTTHQSLCFVVVFRV